MGINKKSEVEDFFDRKSSTWDSHYRNNNNLIAQRIDIFYDSIKKFSSRKLNILDIGCGTGDITFALHDKGNNLTSLDISSKMLKKASKRFPDKDINWILINDSGKLPLNSYLFDVVLISSVLEYHSKPELLIYESYRVLKDNGLLIFTIPDMRNPIRKKEEKLRFLSRNPFWYFIKYTKWFDFFKTIRISKNRYPLDKWVSISKSAGFKCEFNHDMDHPLKLIKAFKNKG